MNRFGAIFATLILLVSAVNSPAYGQLFGERTDYPTGSYPLSIFSVDFDNDGDNDLAVAIAGSNCVSVFFNNGDGTFPVSTNYNTGNYPNSVFASDFDSDYDYDLVVTNQNSHNVSILLNNGDGTFQNAVNYNVGNHPKKVYSKDLDGDNDNDLAVTNRYSNNVSVLLNNGNGTFQNAINYAAGEDPISVFSADLDGDGDNDLAATNLYSYDISILLNNGDGTFQPSYSYAVGPHPHDVTSYDFDSDGDNDLAVINNVDHNISILLNNGNGTFQDTVNYAVGQKPLSIFSIDLDGDGDSDLATANSWSDDVSILINNGDGTFQDQITYAVGDYPFSVFSIDLDGDGDNDLAIANPSSNDFSILMNLTINIGSICVSVNSEDGSSVQGVIVTVIDENNDPTSAPQQTDELGTAIFDPVDVGVYSVMVVTPLGYTVVPAETQTNVSVFSGDCTEVDFVLSPTVVTNDSRTIGYWKHQFNVYTSGRGNAQESYADLETYLNLVHQHFSILGVYVNIENFTLEDAKNVLTVRGGSLMLDRAKQQLFALLLNLASSKIGQETVVSYDGQVSAEAVTYVSTLINDGNPENDELAKDICDLTNNGQLVEAGVIPESPVRYKFVPDVEPRALYSVQNYPNPFNAQTTINFALPKAAFVALEVYDLLGRSVAVLVNSKLPAGYHSVTWDAGDQSSGMYFYKIETREFIETRKMLILK